MFKDVAKANRQFPSNWLRQGRYLCRIESVTTINTRKGDGWKLDLLVLEAIDDDEGKGHKPGEVVQRIRYQSQDGTLAEFKTLVCCMYECQDEEVGTEECDTICSDKNPLGGRFVEVQASTVETRQSTPESQKFFTRVDFLRPLEEDEARELIAPEVVAKYLDD